MRLVNADDAVNRFEELKPKGSSLDVRYAYGISVGLEMAKHVTMFELSTVDAVPVRHGRWNCSDDLYESAVCSCCGWDTTEPWVHIKEWFHFCPNCGADMRKEGDA